MDQKPEIPLYRWIVLFAPSYAFVTFAFALQTVPPLMSPMIHEFNISHVQGGLLMSMAVIPGIFLATPAGMLVDRYGVKLSGLLSITLTATGCLITAIVPAIVPQYFSSRAWQANGNLRNKHVTRYFDSLSAIERVDDFFRLALSILRRHDHGYSRNGHLRPHRQKRTLKRDGNERGSDVGQTLGTLKFGRLESYGFYLTLRPCHLRHGPRNYLKTLRA